MNDMSKQNDKQMNRCEGLNSRENPFGLFSKEGDMCIGNPDLPMEMIHIPTFPVIWTHEHGRVSVASLLTYDRLIIDIDDSSRVHSVFLPKMMVGRLLEIVSFQVTC